MQIAMAVGGCSGDDADLLRRAMGSKRGIERIERLRETLYAGMAEHGITGDLADDIYDRIQAFANFGFAESHAISFGLIVYASSWLKLHYPGAFLAALLRSQPMGFYSPQSLTADARRHGVTTLRPDVLHSGVHADLEPVPEICSSNHHSDGVGRWFGEQISRSGDHDACLDPHQPPIPPFDPDGPDPTETHRRDGAFAVRLGLTEVQGIGEADAQRVVDARAERPFTDMPDVARRTGLSVAQMEALATAGAFDGFGISRRQALWNAGYTDAPDRLAGTAVQAPPPMLPGMNPVEQTLADLWATRISPDEHPMEHLRSLMISEGVLSVADTATHEADRRVRVAGLVTHRQRPYTAGGVTFLNIEDETGMLNVVVFDAIWQRHRRVARNSAGLVIRGMLERQDGVVNLVADKIERIETLYPQLAPAVPARPRSRDFR